jgi:hypothetical protein
VPRTEPWTIADLLDFEYLLAADVDAEDALLRDRDRDGHRIDAAIPDRRVLFKRWVEARRKATTGGLPGEHFRTGWQTLLTLAMFAGLGIGVSLTAGLLHYRGEEPVNVAWFFAATVGVQALLLVLAFAVWLLRRTTGLLDDFRPLQALLAAALWALSAGLSRLPGTQREQIRALLATLRHRREIYGSITIWPLLVVTQLFGVCFNVGVLATLLLHVALNDVAFGWQSTLRTSPEQAFHIVSVIATPWAFAPAPHPSFDQVVASRFAYSAGIQPLSPTAMASWWPFLCYAVAVYGLLVRALLLAWAATKWRRALDAIAFDHHGCNTLFRRLSGPIIHTETETAGLEIPAASESIRHHAAGACFALVAQELTVDAALLTDVLRRHYAWQLGKMLPVPIDHPSGSVAALAELEKAAPTLASVAVIVPARRPPIKAIALFLQKVAGAIETKTEVLVLLVGRLENGGFAPVSDEEFTYWRNFNAIHGLHLAVEKWPAA